MTFTHHTHAKWILLGEHAVLRGSPAIVFPKKDAVLTVKLTKSDQPFHVVSDTNNLAIEKALTQLIAIEAKNHQLILPSASFEMTNAIPIGKGFGFSAALSLCIAQFLIHLGAKIPVFNLAKSIEDHFHGKSSGLDIAGCLHQTPIFYHQQNASPIPLTTYPNIQLTDTGPSELSSTCITKVQNLFQSQPSLAENIDQQMKEAVIIAHDALKQNNISSLAHAIEQANDCFDRWGLINERTRTLMRQKKKQGALASKPSGAGLGGLMISLMDQ